jgi:alkylhydroperoxidase family enzyme
MSFVPLRTRDSLSPEGQRRWDAEIVRSGADPTHMKRALLNHLPSYDALMAWYPLYSEVQRFIGDRGAIVFSYAISSTNECLLCTTYFRRDLVARGEDINAGDLTPEEEDIAAFGQALARHDPSDEALVRRLTGRYGDEAVVALVGFGILMIGNNIVNSFLGVELDPGLRELADRLAAQAAAERAAAQGSGPAGPAQAAGLVRTGTTSSGAQGARA